MDMNPSTMSNMTEMMMMKPYLHFTPGDILYFSTLAPSSTGAMVGTCLVLFMIAILERLFAAYARSLAAKWKGNVRISEDPPCCEGEPLSANAGSRRTTAPFIPRVEFQRAACRVVAATISYTLMLAVMTFNLGFILSVIVGLGVGELAFGRFGVRA
ncbi:Ctr copper transporter [Hysterangium stoloniferum]|nr:Ctr copper transporter [Hysterangium stoloniferum]